MENIVSKEFQTPIEIALGVDSDGMTTAKKLYEFLELEPKNYSRWCKTNIVQNEFAEENVDYWAFVVNDERNFNPNPTTDYKLTAHFAKKLSVKGNSARAEEAREYFTRLEEKAKQHIIDRAQLSPQTQLLLSMSESIARTELEQKRQAEQIQRLEDTQHTLVETFQHASGIEDFQTWANRCLAKIAESPKFDRGYGRSNNYAFARNESYERLKKKWNCNLNDRVSRARGRAMEKNPGISKAKLNAINKLSVISDDKSLRPVYETVIKEMMIAYCVEK